MAPARPPGSGGGGRPAGAGQNETTPAEQQINSLLTQAQGLDQEADDISGQITNLQSLQDSYESQAKAAEQAASAASSSSSSSTSSSTSASTSSSTTAASTSPTVTGTAAGSTSSSSAAESDEQLAASYEAQAQAVGQQITQLQTQVTSLHSQAAQLRQQASQVHGAPQQQQQSKSDTRRHVAAVLTDTKDVYVSFPILKTETNADGDLIVYGKATDGTVDSDDQIVDSKWSAAALKTWLATGGNVRVQHQANRDPAGVGLKIDLDKDGDGGHYLQAEISEPIAKKLVSKGALRAFSVGIMRPKIVTDNKARGGRIVGGELGEVSLVDRPANRNCAFTLVKSDKDGNAEWLGALNADPDFVARALTPTPSDMARMLGKSAVAPPPQQPDVEAGFIPAAPFANPVANRLQEALRLDKRELASGRVVDSGGRDVTSLDDKDFAGPHKTFPIKTQDDVSDAASLAHHAADPSAVRSRIRSIASRKWPGMKLPPSLSGGDDSSKTTTEPDVGKAGAKACPKCGKNYHADSKMMNCESCGTKLPVAKAEDGECSLCHGTGKILDGHRKCPDCGGSGKQSVSKGHDDGDLVDRMAENDDNDNDDDSSSDSSRGDTSADASGNVDGDGPDAATDDEDEDGIKTAKGKMFCPACGSGLKKKGSFCPGCGAKVAMPSKTKHVIPHSHPSPGDGARGKDTKPVPAHREPDGPQTEDFEKDAGMEDADGPDGAKPAEPAPTWSASKGTDPAAGVDNKKPTDSGPAEDDEEQRDNNAPYLVSSEGAKMRQTQAPYSLMRSHDALCAAYDGPAVLAEYPSLKGYADAVDSEAWRNAARDVVNSGNLSDGQKALGVAAAAEHLKALDPAAVEDGRAALRKAFADMYPSVHLTPGQVTAQQFHRPYISDGHAPLSAQPPGSQPDAKIPPQGITASQFTRPWISDGHQSQSPADGGTRVESFGGVNASHMSAPKGSAMSAMTVIHDSIADSFPDLCPMGHSSAVPAAAHKDAIDARNGSMSQIATQISNHVQASIPAAATQVTKAAEPLVPVTRNKKTKKTKSASPGAAVLAKMQELTDQNAALLKAFGEREAAAADTITKMQAQIDELGSQPDPYLAPLRAAVYGPDHGAESGAGTEDRRSTVEKAAMAVHDEKLAFLQSLTNSGDPTVREGAQAQIRKMLGAP